MVRRIWRLSGIYLIGFEDWRNEWHDLENRQARLVAEKLCLWWSPQPKAPAPFCSTNDMVAFASGHRKMILLILCYMFVAKSSITPHLTSIQLPCLESLERAHLILGTNGRRECAWSRDFHSSLHHSHCSCLAFASPEAFEGLFLVNLVTSSSRPGRKPLVFINLSRY